MMAHPKIKTFLWLVLFLAHCAFAGCGSGGSSGGSGGTSGGSSGGTSGGTSGGNSDPAFAKLSRSEGLFSLPEGMSFVWPVKRDQKRLAAPFGPRLKDGKPDFHRAIDVSGSLDEDVFSITDGEIYQVFAEGGDSPYSGGGNVVLTVHSLPQPFTFLGKSITKFYVLYYHLNGFSSLTQSWLDDPANAEWLKDKSKPKPSYPVKKGDVIGKLGKSGNASSLHVHLEIRLQDTCSFAACPDKLGFDPHVNPVQFLLSNDPKTGPIIESVQKNGDKLDVTVATDALLPDFDYMNLRIEDGEENELLSKKIGFNARESFDASSTSALDDFQLDGIFVDPAPFSSETSTYRITFHFDIADIADKMKKALILVEDVWGNETGEEVNF